MNIYNTTADVLARSTVDGDILYLPEGQLERKIYTSVNKILAAIGGKWNRSKKGHIFSESPEDSIEQILLTGEYTDDRKKYQFFETPVDLAGRLVAMACVEEGQSIGEPSAGNGRIAEEIEHQHPYAEIHAIELNPECHKVLEGGSINLKSLELGDFLDSTERRDVFIANPPFTRQQDIDHVNHMLDLANNTVVSVMSASVLFRTNKKTVDFRERIESLGGEFIELPEYTFKESGTKVNTIIVSVRI